MGVTRRPSASIEIRHLVTMAAVARERSFREAAESLGYVQSAVSSQLAQLERIAGTRLVDRGRGGSPLALTEAGRMLVAHSDEILAQLGTAREELASVLERPVGLLALGVDQSVAKHLLPSILSSWSHRQPAVDVQLTESVRGDDLIGQVLAGDLDLAIAPPTGDDGLERHTLFRDPYRLLVPAEWRIARLARSRPVTLAELATLPMVGPGGRATAPQVEATFRRHGFEPDYVLRSDLDGTVGALVGAGLGTAILPSLAIDATDPRTIPLPLGDLVAPREFVLCWRTAADSSPALETFCEIAKTACADLVDQLPSAA